MTKKKSKIVQYLVNLFMLSAIILASFSIFIQTIYYGILYITIVILCIFLVIYFRCTKCPCKKDNCTHIWFGKIANRIREKKSSEYTNVDNIVMVFYLLGIMAFPIPWLIQNLIFLILFYILMIITYLLGPLHACRRCENYNCISNRTKK